MRLVTSADDNCISNNKIINVSEASATVNDGNGYTSNPSVMDQPTRMLYMMISNVVMMMKKDTLQITVVLNPSHQV